MFICEIWLFVWYFPQLCISDMSKYGYIEVFRGSLRLRDNESRLYMQLFSGNKRSQTEKKTFLLCNTHFRQETW